MYLLYGVEEIAGVPKISALLGGRNVVFVCVPQEQLGTGGAEKIHFEVCVGNPGGRKHHASF